MTAPHFFVFYVVFYRFSYCDVSFVLWLESFYFRILHYIFIGFLLIKV